MITPRGRIAVAGSDSGEVSEACRLFEGHGYACTNDFNPEQIPIMLQDDLVDVVVAVGSDTGDILAKAASMSQDGAWKDSVVVVGEVRSGRCTDNSLNPVTAGLSEDGSQLVSVVAEKMAIRRLAKRLSDTNRLLAAWKSDMDAWTGLSALSPFAEKGRNGPIGVLGALVSVHDQIKDISFGLDSQAPFSGRCREHQCAVYVELLHAIRHTIEVLRKTKQSFKSKELGELRAYLESLMTEHS